MDNAHAGGMFIAINDDGTLHETAFTEFNDQYTKHPDTGFVFNEAKISNFDKVMKAATDLHGAIPQIGIVNWDFTIDQDGDPVLIEANMNNGKQSGSIWLPEIAHGKGAFGKNTKEILQYLKSVRGIPKSKQKEYD